MGDNFRQGRGGLLQDRYSRNPYNLGGRHNATIDTMEVPFTAAAIPGGARAIACNAILCDIPPEGLNCSSIAFQGTTAFGAITAAGQWQFAWFTVSATNQYPKRMLAGTKSTAATLASVWDGTLEIPRFSWATPARVTREMLYSATTLASIAALVMMCEHQYTAPGPESNPTLRAYTCRGITFGDDVAFQNSLGATWAGAALTFGTFPGEAADIDTNANWNPLSSAPGTGTNEPGHFVFSIANAPVLV